MTFNEIKSSTQMYLLATDINELLGRNPQGIRESAKLGNLPFPYEIRGKADVRIPRKTFIEWYERHF